MIRKIARFVLASLLWLHALLLFEIAKPNLAPIASRLNLNLGEVTVLCFLAASSVLVTYGIGNILIDITYIYFFPFVLLYFAGRGAYKVVRTLNRIFAGLGTDQVEPLDLISIPGLPSPAASTATVDIKPDASPKPAEFTKSFWQRLRELVVTPFVRFSLLWCMLLLLTTRPVLLWIALMIVLMHIGRALVAIIGVAIFSTNWLSQMEDRIKSHAENWIDKVLATNESSPPQDLGKTVSVWASLQLGLGLLRNRQRVAQWAMFLGLLVFVSVYLYLALLFSFAYCGIAKITHVALAWSDSLVCSIFIPFAFSDLPRNPWLKGVAGFHAVFVLLLGISTVYGYFQSKLNALYNVADSLNSRMQQPDVRTKIIVITELFKTTNAGVKSTKANEQ